MKLVALFMACLSAAWSIAPEEAFADANGPRNNFSEDLYYASVDASGSRLCDGEKRAEYGDRFKHRFGKRVSALKTAHLKRFGPDPEFIVTTSCRLWRGSETEQARKHALAMKAFEVWLSAAEAALGLSR